MTWQSFKQAWLIRFWSPVPAVIAAGILSTYYWHHRHLLGGDRRIHPLGWSAAGSCWASHSEQWGYYQLIHLEGSPLTRIDGRMIIGMFGGCLAARAVANNVKLRLPRSRIRIAQAVAGGIIAGSAHGWRWAATWRPSSPAFRSSPCTPGCLPSPPPSAPGLAPRFTLLPLFRIPVKIQKVSTASPLTQKPQQARRRSAWGWWSFSP
ncbi:putative inner membrane protein [Klebsiella pneumoniae]|uniref:Putative inner membrane protein n=1 Tax=Klebsiella pneumoniae TaxID=573 RepID=A0A378F3T8_KLEPN|nr:putative inner membrane protein [Klebsiella pneumoniae]